MCIKYKFRLGNGHQINFKYRSARGHIKLYQKTLASQVRFSLTDITHTIVKKEKDLSRQIKSEVRRLKADFLANHNITDMVTWQLETFIAHIKRSRGQSRHISSMVGEI